MDLWRFRRTRSGLLCHVDFCERRTVWEGRRKTGLLPFASSVPHADACAAAGVGKVGWRQSGGPRLVAWLGPFTCWTGRRSPQPAREARRPVAVRRSPCGAPRGGVLRIGLPGILLSAAQAAEELRGALPLPSPPRAVDDSECRGRGARDGCGVGARATRCGRALEPSVIGAWPGLG
ncbi:hypothetical protein NDU88_002758 [Pleurodeles waltl]|uniref:Uncharacterized protein n=1 Tax=Pleurodeles waltl TaxID=8319 RepID=A0AAV7KZW7_PLEWA|nr:hypothetical protein NDU88_002758 [Pleurodeles waltl]